MYPDFNNNNKLVMKSKKYRILLVDDEKDVLEFLSYNIRKEGFEVFTAMSGKEAISLAKEVLPHLILLDVMMPEMDGIETCEELRNIPELRDVLIAYLTARGEDYSQIAGFEAGGDDYIVKPIRPKVLISRLKALLKRYSGDETEKRRKPIELIQKGELILDREKYIVIKEGNELILPKKEFELLSVLISKPEKVFSRDEIYRKVWGENVFVGDRTIDVHIRKIREKIGEKHIKTVKGIGYKYIV
jgi:two-component system alkaline phosphatase synthesis response regulator PhoP